MTTTNNKQTPIVDKHDNHGMDDYFKGKWNEFKGKVKEEWGDLTDDDLKEIDGKREKLSGRLQARYGWERSRADQEMDRFKTKYMR